VLFFCRTRRTRSLSSIGAKRVSGSPSGITKKQSSGFCRFFCGLYVSRLGCECCIHQNLHLYQICFYLCLVFFIVSKILTTLLRPLFWLLVLLMWSFFAKKPKRKTLLVAIALALLFLSSNKVLVNELAILWEPSHLGKTAANPRVAVVLGGFSDYDEYRHEVVLTEAAARLYKAIELFKNHTIDTIIVSGGAASITGKIRPESIYARRYLIGMGIDSSKILIDTISINTYENAVETAKILKSAHSLGPVYLITTASHMPRAKATFSKAGILVVPKPVQFFSNPARQYILSDWFIPSSEALQKFDALAKEWVGVVAYKLSGKSN